MGAEAGGGASAATGRGGGAGAQGGVRTGNGNEQWRQRKRKRSSDTVTGFFHSQKAVLKNTGLLSSAAHAQCSLSNQNDCSRCAATEDCAAVLACAAQPKSGGESVPSRS